MLIFITQLQQNVAYPFMTAVFFYCPEDDPSHPTGNDTVTFSGAPVDEGFFMSRSQIIAAVAAVKNVPEANVRFVVAPPQS